MSVHGYPPHIQQIVDDYERYKKLAVEKGEEVIRYNEFTRWYAKLYEYDNG